MHWFFTGLLILASAGTVAFTGMLLRRLFTTAPDRPDAPHVDAPHVDVAP